MSGHSKWSTIKHKKAAADSKRGKAFTKLIREVTSAARGGGDPGGNARLRVAIDKARAANMPKDTIDRAIKKGTGELGGAAYEEVTYEGFGPGGVAMLVDTLTDNRVRTVADLRFMFSKCGGTLGEAGSVGWMFEKKGRLSWERRKIRDFDVFQMSAIDAGAADIDESDPDAVTVVTAPADYEKVRIALIALAGEPDLAELGPLAQNLIEIERDVAAKLQRLIGLLDDYDDVQEVFHAADIDPAFEDGA